MGGPALTPEEWDKVEVPAAEDVAAQAAVEGVDTDDAGLSESFDSAGKLKEAATAAPGASVSVSPQLTP